MHFDSKEPGSGRTLESRGDGVDELAEVVAGDDVRYDRLSVPGPRAVPPRATAVPGLRDGRKAQRASGELDALARRSGELLEQLQRALVPRARIDERWGVAWRYRPSDDAMRIGGDFLGVLERQTGSLALLIGDVTGRGAAAAGLGATLRSAWLGTVHAGISTSEIPAVLDRLLEHHTNDPGVFATACFVEVDPFAGEVRAVSAGHDPPLLITPGATTALPVDPGPALGLGVSRDWPLARVELPSPGAVLLYTDGLTEADGGPGAPRIGVEGLRGRVEASSVLTQPAWQALDELLEASLPESIHELDDDLAVMLVAPRPEFVRSRHGRETGLNAPA
jgi:serine phosphatase RsbU (regulator of sigma subunit)